MVNDCDLEFTRYKETVSTSCELLSLHSEVFQQLIEGNKSLPVTVVEIEDDTRPQIAREALNCIATSGKSLHDIATALEVREFGRKYRMKLLNDACKRFICSKMTAENVAEVHDFACAHGDEVIQFHCWNKFDECWRSIFSSPSFYECGPQTVMRLVSRPVYEDMDEYLLWNAVYTWGFHKISSSNLKYQKDTHRKVIQDYLPHIRFLAMKKVELDVVFESEILMPEEALAIWKAYYTSNTRYLPSGFCKEVVQRRKTFKSDYISHVGSFYCPKHSLLRWLKAGDTFYTEFRVKKDCFFLGSLLPLRVHKKPICGFIEISKLNSADVLDQPSWAGWEIRSVGNVLTFRPAVFLEESCTVRVKFVVTEDNLWCTLEPYACCNISTIRKDVCEEADEWKSFYLKDLLIYF